MARARTLIAVLLLALAGAGQGLAEADARAQTLADIRQELSVLHVEIQQLKRELSTTGAPSGSGVVGAGTLLERLDAIEAALTELTARTEALEHRIDRIVRDGTNRIGDLEFRLVELEGGDVSKLGETTTLGGGPAPEGPAVAPTPPAGQQLAVGEQADFDAAQKALEAGNFAEAARGFARFVEAYPGSPLMGEAHFLRGQALAGQGLTTQAARAYLTSFSGDPDGRRAPDALFELGVALGDLGQVNEACATLAEVPKRFADSPVAADARTSRQALGCN